MKKTWLMISVVMVIWVLAACAPTGSQQGGDLTGRVWILTELMGKPPVTGTIISAEFSADGRVMGSAGCNQYNSTYTISGSTITVSSPIASTMMMCDQSVMDQESAYLNALGIAKTFAVTGDQLTLIGEDGTQLVVFKVQSQDLAGTSWQATAYNNGNQAVVGVLQGTILTVSFDKGGQLAGNAGCNQYSGAYTVNGEQITVGPLASTMMMCDEPEGIMDQEAQFLAALQSAATYQIVGNVLELRTKDDAVAGLFKR
jgi:heat shock protein HslJ